jgi:hypothetical protein
MSLPATRFALPHVGSTGNQGSDLAACADPQVRRLLWRRQLAQWSVRSHDVRDFQRRYLPELSQAPAAPTDTRTAHDAGLYLSADAEGTVMALRRETRRQFSWKV